MTVLFPFFIINIFFLHLKYGITKTISIPYIVLYGQYQIKLSLGDPVQDVTLPIIQAIPFTWTSEYHFTSPTPLSYNNTIFINEIPYKGELMTETINLEKEDNIEFFNFYMVGDYDVYSNNTNGFSFSYQYEENSFSIIHLFYQNNVISYLSYGFIPETSHHGTFYFGQIPEKKLENFTSKVSLKVNENYISWGTEIDAIYYGNKNEKKYLFENKENNKYGFFESGNEYIRVPDYYWSFLIKNKFRIFIDNSVFFNKKKKEINYICCKDNNLSHLQKMNFVFGNVTFSIPIKNLVDCNYKLCNFEIVYDEKNINNYWSFGTTFLNNYISEFDYSQRKIKFYSNNNEYIFFYKYLDNSIKYFITMNLIILFFGIIEILFCIILFKMIK